MNWVTAISAVVQKFSERATELLTLNNDSYTKIKNYNDTGLKQTASDDYIYGLSLAEVQILNPTESNSVACFPAFWSATQIGIMYSTPTLSGGFYYPLTYNAYRTYDLSNFLLSSIASVTVDWTASLQFPVRKTSTGYVGPGTYNGIAGRATDTVFTYNSSFAGKGTVTLSCNKAIPIPWHLLADKIYLPYTVSTDSLNDVYIPQIAIAEYDLSGALTDTDYVNYEEISNFGGQQNFIQLYGDFLMYPKVLFGKQCILVENLTNGKIYHIPIEQLALFGICGVQNRNRLFYPRYNAPEWSYGHSSSAGFSSTDIVDMFVDTSIHLLGIIRYTNKVVYFRFLIPT